jgi:hypothetical protein
MIAAAVLVILLIIFIGRFAGGGKNGKGAPSARLAAVLAVIILIWLIVTVRSPSEGSSVAGYGANGISEAVTGFVNFLHDIFG